MTRRDSSLDSLLELHDQILVIDETGYWVKFVVSKVPMALDRPHGLRLLGFDNAHQVKGHRVGDAHAMDHRHRFRSIKPYEYVNAALLLADFLSEVESVMRQKGVWT
jgi:hypothetical protein